MFTRKHHSIMSRGSCRLRLWPDCLLIALLATVAILFLSERQRWFSFNAHKGWTVLIAVTLALLTFFVLLIWHADSLLYRRHFRFGICSLLILIIAIAVPGLWFSYEIRDSVTQKYVLKDIDKKKSCGYAHPVDELDWPALMLRGILGEDFFVGVPWIFLSGRDVGDPILKDISSVRQLKRLTIYVTRISDDGLRYLGGLPNLQELVIDYTDITDAGLEHLRRLTCLRHLYLVHTKCTISGVESLQRYLPDCEITLSEVDLGFGFHAKRETKQKECAGPAKLDNRREGEANPEE